ncbi:hypothetical protein D0501_06575 [Leuconostoc holzapfelii]|uniref:Uncharacterized protein n=1 Tax=Leuconostoc holzapfelii TaxID=434464 RepID=A0ABT2NWJ0_9LACO|nr:hypothetical protein [Leuconostoc holzapfelii]MCT8389735.1 hypothetical protein [Leuconostoc holzapfelii]
MVIIDQIKRLITQIRTIRDLTKQLQSQQAQLSAQLEHVKVVQDEIQVEVEKMTFKNKPHLDRIQEATTHLNAELSKFKA